jgi:hypothetical protein
MVSFRFLVYLDSTFGLRHEHLVEPWCRQRSVSQTPFFTRVGSFMVAFITLYQSIPRLDLILAPKYSHKQNDSDGTKVQQSVRFLIRMLQPR